MDNIIIPQKLALLRHELSTQQLDGFVIPMNDEFQCEYVPDSARRVQFMTHFTGSAGLAIVLKDKAAFFTDGRYTLQAQDQVDSKYYQLFDSTELSPQTWLKLNLPAGAVLGFDPWLHTADNATFFAAACAKAGGEWRACETNPVDAIWRDRPLPPLTPIIAHDIRYAGETSAAKRTRIAQGLQAQGADTALLTLADSICWLLNIRGSDVHATPFSLCFALLHADSTVDLYVDERKVNEQIIAYLGNDIRIFSINKLEYSLNNLKNKHILYDKSASAVWFLQQFEQIGANIIAGNDPCQLPKACKNAVEIAGMESAHIRDGAAVVHFLYWMENALTKEHVTEVSAAEKLLSFRQQQQDFCYPSFDTIAGFAEHGAIVHYHATQASDKALAGEGLFLLDSGGQYKTGTTDITRTISIGTPSTEQITRFTQVLKGHIALAMAKFPEGTTGSQLDVLARYPLWQAGCDYGHGTGHGVGSFLSVHEGPQRISKAPNTIALQPGMVLSNEPGYYKTGAYGIRIESLVVVERCNDNSEKPFLQFRTLTRAPIDLKLIDKNLLTKVEIDWLNAYHRIVYEDLLPYCQDMTMRQWLDKQLCNI